MKIRNKLIVGYGLFAWSLGISGFIRGVGESWQVIMYALLLIGGLSFVVWGLE